MGSACSVSWCERPVRGKKNLCDMHRQRLRKATDLDFRPAAPRKAGEDFLHGLVGTQDTECIPWPYATFSSGVGHAHWEGRSISASRLMCILAHGEPPFTKAEAAHSCGNGHKGCVNPNHLRWDTRKGNADDMIKHGTLTTGARNGMATLTEDAVRSILGYKGKGISQSQVGVIFGISQTHVGDIWRGRRWGHLSVEE
jgi:hypothetical protein